MPAPRFLDREHFISAAGWKSPRPKHLYAKNEEQLVLEATRLAYLADSDRLKLHVLSVLKGVDVAIAATLLHFLLPDQFPIFDIRVRRRLAKAGYWHRPLRDASEESWLGYIELMRRLSAELDVTLRDLDKALFAADRWGQSEEDQD
jgi:hypothetical protein